VSADRAGRVYRSPRREAQARHTRMRVLEAASAEFLNRGYGGATMRAIAEAAGVSVATVELLFGTKARVLKAAIDVAIAGDDEPRPVLEREWAAEAQRAGTAEELLDIAARVLTPAQRRSAGLVMAAFEAARVDPDLAEVAAQLTAQRRVTAEWLVDALATTARLRDEPSEAVETLWVLMDPVVFDRLVRNRGWTPERYQRWWARSARRLLTSTERDGT
jgi:AcrR family transcriptional regulator